MGWQTHHQHEPGHRHARSRTTSRWCATQARDSTVPSPDCGMLRLRPQVQLARALYTSPTCSMSLGGHTPTKIHRTLTKVLLSISQVELSPTARWLTRTRLWWQRKTNGTSRHIKKSEILRSAYVKRQVNLV